MNYGFLLSHLQCVHWVAVERLIETIFNKVSGDSFSCEKE